ncbi:MAG TPA: FHA domain-containing protein [Haliangium sp.]|nr:FHA domain-containing protein [Haliangium sp.]
MLAIIVIAKGGERRRLELDKLEITIGRAEENDVILPDGDVSRLHARIMREGGKLVIIDLESTNGTYVNGRKITRPRVIEASDTIRIGDFLLGVEESGAAGLVVGAATGVAPLPGAAPNPPPPPNPALPPDPAYLWPTEQTRDLTEWPLAATPSFSYAAPPGVSLPPISGGALTPLSKVLDGPDDQPADPPESAARQLVSIGFAHGSTPAEPLPDTRTLAARGRYLLWVEIGPELVRGALGGAAALPDVLVGSELDVVIFGFPGQLGIDPERRRGTLRIAASGSAEVTRPAATPRGTGALGRRRLFFPIQTPRRPGRYSVRCNVYHRLLLLQSHLITVEVTQPAVGREKGALQRITDYTLSASLDVGRLAKHGPHRLSILHNDDGAGTHGFRFVGQDDFVADASIDGATLGGLVDYARGALRRVAWGTTAPWRSSELDPYRYAAPVPPAQLADDLILLARHGYRLWSEALAFFGVRGPERQKLRALMRTPGAVQLAIKENANHVFPAALLYDHPLDTGRDRLALCQTAAAALKAGAELETSACFSGQCPSHGDDTVVCPSGFWGFRHELGVPLHLGQGGEVATEIVCKEKTRALIGVTTDPSFAARIAHVDRLRTLRARRALLEAAVLDERNACIQALKRQPPHLAYFFCHGGITGSGTPYIEIGARKSEPITADVFTEIWWQEPRPLIVLNGCHTTAASPEQVFSMITGFVVQANAAGVVGTEITIFEPMAVSFAEEMLREFFAGETIGRAVRRARLALLRQGNPLGLAYIPFALSTLRLTDAA